MNYRLEMAKRWLTETDMTIREIAERLQYHNPQNFIRSFRKKEQVTPGAYRKLKQGSSRYFSRNRGLVQERAWIRGSCTNGTVLASRRYRFCICSKVPVVSDGC